MQALIDFIIRNLMALWPIARVYEWETALMMRNGRINRKLKPGIHWRWLFIEEVKKAWSTELNVDLNTAAIVTTDGKPIIVGANISYRIADLATLWRTLCNSNETIRNLSIGFLATRCAMRSWAELSADRMKIEEEMRLFLEHHFSQKGLHIIRVQLIDLAPARLFRLFGDGHKVV